MRREKKAFTLIEATLAISLTALIVLAFFASLITSVTYVRKSLELRNSSLILQEQMSMIRELKYADIQALGNTFSSANMSSLKDASGAINKSYYGAGDKIIKLTLELTWTTFDGKNTSKYLSTLITDHGINKK